MTIPGLVCAALLMTAPGATPELDEGSFSHWRDYVLPDADELAWREIPWEISFWDAVQRAQRERKPLLIWAMNGHPLACT